MAKAASPRQLKLLKALAARTGTSFFYDPKEGLTMRQASEEIARLKDLGGAGRSAAELAERQGSGSDRGDQERDERYGTARFSESHGYGSTASYIATPRDPAAAPQLTDAQERAIISLQQRTGDESVQSTVAEASDYLDGAYERPEPPPTQRQLEYLHSLERKLDLRPSHPGSSLGASRRIERYVSQLEQHVTDAGVNDLAVTLALAGAASPQSIQEVAAVAPPDTVAWEDARDVFIRDESPPVRQEDDQNASAAR